MPSLRKSRGLIRCGHPRPSATLLNYHQHPRPELPVAGAAQSRCVQGAGRKREEGLTGIRTFELGNSKLAVLGKTRLALTRLPLDCMGRGGMQRVKKGIEILLALSSFADRGAACCEPTLDLPREKLTLTDCRALGSQGFGVLLGGGRHDGRRGRDIGKYMLLLRYELTASMHGPRSLRVMPSHPHRLNF
jgi:hypothetical protein